MKLAVQETFVFLKHVCSFHPSFEIVYVCVCVCVRACVRVQNRSAALENKSTNIHNNFQIWSLNPWYYND